MSSPCAIDAYSPSVTSVTAWKPSGADDCTTIRAVACVASTIVNCAVVTPGPKSAVVPPSSQCVPWPTIATLRTWLCAATLGVTERICDGPRTTVKPAPDTTSCWPDPVGVTTMTVFGPIGAVADTATVAVAVVGLVTLKSETVTPAPRINSLDWLKLVLAPAIATVSD